MYNDSRASEQPHDHSPRRVRQWEGIRAVLRLRLVRRGLILALLALVLHTLYGWYQASPYVQARELAAARVRWENRSFLRYDLEYTIRDENIGVTREGWQHRSVTDLFRWIENYPRSVEFRCAGLNFDCAMPETYSVQAVYDAQLGYPHRFQLTRARHPDWFNPTFWRWLIDSGHWRACPNLTCTTTDRITITLVSLTPQPES